MLNTKVEHLSIEEFLKLKYLEYKDNETSKYFFLYFLHLLGFFDYEEKDGKAEFSNIETSIEVPLPIIDSDEKFNEMESVHRSLEMFRNNLTEYKNMPHTELKFVDDI